MTVGICITFVTVYTVISCSSSGWRDDGGGPGFPRSGQSQPGAAEPLDAARGVVYKHRSADRQVACRSRRSTFYAPGVES